MYCAKCGSKLLDGAIFCSKCGAPVNETQVQTNAVEQTKREEESPVKQKLKSRRPKKTAMPILFALIGLVVLVGCGFLIRSFFKGTPDLMENAWYGNSSENIACGAAYVEKDGIIYFDSPISDAIYAVDQFGTTAYQVIPDSINESDNRYLNISRDGFLYYVTGFSSDQIVKLDLGDPSKEIETIYEAKSGKILDLTIVDDNIYFRVGDTFESQIYMADKDCKSVSKIAKGGPMTVRNGWIYYAGGKNTSNVYRIRSNGAEKEKIYERDGLISSIFTIDNCLYFVGYNSDSAGCVDIESKSYQGILPDNSDVILDMNYFNGDPILFHSEYTESQNRGVLYQENEDTKDIVKVPTDVGHIWGCSVIGKNIYYPATGQQGFSDEFEGWRDICAYRVNIDTREGEYILLDSEGDSSLLRSYGNNPSPTENYGSEVQTEISNNDDGNDDEVLSIEADIQLPDQEDYWELNYFNLTRYLKDCGAYSVDKSTENLGIDYSIVTADFGEWYLEISTCAYEQVPNIYIGTTRPNTYGFYRDFDYDDDRTKINIIVDMDEGTMVHQVSIEALPDIIKGILKFQREEHSEGERPQVDNCIYPE
ncbi:MAG: DUF5050 domain-containing protein [Lachnospiraceae bacterium]|nr:DUF5050 domain-containing protein [Lachnospiraceae bacterium]